MTSTGEAADFMALNALLNACAREHPEIMRETCPLSGRAALAFRLETPARGVLFAPVLRDGAFRRRYAGHAVWRREGEAPRRIDAEEALEFLTGDARLCAGSTEARAHFRQRCLASLAAQRRAAPARGRAEDWSFIEAEQALTAGHPHHPNPRSRDGMTPEEEARYAPERRGRFPLFWVLAREDHIIGDGAAQARALLAADPAARRVIGDIPAGFAPLPWHPWQAQRILASPFAEEMRRRGDLIVIGEAGRPWAATASMRCLHAPGAPFMLKTSLSLRLTNSIRALTLTEARRGAQFRALFAGPFGAIAAREAPTLSILHEQGWAALTGPGGAAPETLTIFRDNPFDGTAPGPIMLASLCEDGPQGSPLGAMLRRLNPVAPTRAARRWFRAFLDIAIAPLLRLRARHGLLIGAHQQNMMIELAGGWPRRAWVRDGQGVGQIRGFRDHLSAFLPDIGAGAANSVDAALGDRLLCYYVIVNNALNIASALALDGLAEEGALHADLRAFLLAARADDQDNSFHDMLLSGDGLCAKGNFATSLSGVNEADGDAGGQLAAFLDLPNPFRPITPEPTR